MEQNTDQIQSYELDDMRRQLATLKEKIASQEIVNNKMLKRAVAKKLTGIHKFRNRVLAGGIVAIAFTSIYFWWMDLSLYLIGYTELMIFFSLFMTYRYHSQVEEMNGFNDNLLNTVKGLKRLKRNYNRSYFYSVPMVAVFIGWYMHETLSLFDPEMAKSIIIGASVGAVIGLVWGVSLNQKLVRMCDDIISDIEGE